MKVPTIAVVGSLNIDYIASVPRLPAAGETVGAIKLIQRFGGKGANQAVALARQAAHVRMIGCVGEDDPGMAYRARLSREGIDTGGLWATRRSLTGTALIAVDDSAENTIIVAPGANGELKPSMVRNQRKAIETADALLLQFEVPLDSVMEAIRLANQAQVPVFLNPSPLRRDFPWGENKVSTLMVNEVEAKALFALDPRHYASRRKLLQILQRHSLKQLVITRGAKPTLMVSNSEVLSCPAFRVRPVDTVGAGDAFAGAYVARTVEGASPLAALRFANCAGAMATLKQGAQESIPCRRQVERALRRGRP